MRLKLNVLLLSLLCFTPTAYGQKATPEPEPVVNQTREFQDFDPNPIQVCDGSGLGQTTISWEAPGYDSIEVRIHSPTGKLMAGGQSGSTQTGKWVKDGTMFFLVNASNGEVLDRIVVQLTEVGCP
jgi:hypothetical protein